MAYTANISTIIEDVGTIANPSVYNYLRPNAFRFVIDDLPNVAYTCQSANLPGINLGFAVLTSPFLDIPRIGDKVSFGDFTIRFLISEDLSNYIELYEWLVALGFPNNYNEYKNFTGERLNRFPFYKNNVGGTEALAYSDATLMILNSSNVAQSAIKFKDLFPISLEALDFDITSSSVDYFVGIASFKYTTFTIETSV